MEVCLIVLIVASNAGIITDLVLPKKTDRQFGGYYEGNIYIIGGNSGNDKPSNISWIFNTSNFNIIEQLPLQYNIFNGGQSYTTNENGIIYLLSNGYNNVNQYLFEYNMLSNNITIVDDNLPIQTQNENIDGSACLTMNKLTNIIYIIGGSNNTNYALNTVLQYNITSGIWIYNISNISTARKDHTCQYFSYTDTIYIIGGRNINNSRVNTIEMYNVSNSMNNTWQYFNDINNILPILSVLRSVIHKHL